MPEPHQQPDVTIVLASALHIAQPLFGPQLSELGDPPTSGARSGTVLPELLQNLPGDERNVLLTLARMIVTLESGAILAKDEAAARLAGGLAVPAASVLELARLAYLGSATDDWAELSEQARATADLLAARVRAAAAR